MGPYLDEATERELKLEFIPENPQLRQDLESTIDAAADVLGDRIDELLSVPRAGFLKTSLTDDQRWHINNILAPAYASLNAADQQKLLNIPVREIGDPVQSLPDAIRHARVDASFSSAPFHEACGTYAKQKRLWYIREKTCARLISVFQAFNAIGIRPHLEDAFRPEEVQEGLLFRRIASLAQIFPQWTAESVYKVAASLTASRPDLAGHQAATAVDFLLKDKTTDTLLPLGNGYSDPGIHGCIDFPYITWDEYRTRMLFAHICRSGGFRLLPTEDWHVSFGDRGMGIGGEVTNRKAIYGPIKDYSLLGDITPYPEEKKSVPYINLENAAHMISLAREKQPDHKKGYLRTVLRAVSTYRYKMLQKKNI